MYVGQASNDLKALVAEVKARSARDQSRLEALFKAVETDILALDPVPNIPNIMRVLKAIGKGEI